MEPVLVNGGQVVAMCDRDEEKMREAAEHLPEEPAYYTDFDSFIEHDMDAVFLSNCFHEHAQFAVRCLEKGLHVLSECTSNFTMAQGVALVRAAEKSKGIYMLAENYPFMLFNQEMRKVYRRGDLGKVLYAEGEYNHPINMDDKKAHKELRPYPSHWRNYLPRTYYITHSLAPLMYITGAFPKRVCAMPVFEPFDEFEICGSFVGDRAAVITSLNDDNSVFRFTGCAAFGGHENSYRICGTKGQIENVRGMGNTVSVHFNDWEIPNGFEDDKSVYVPDWDSDVKAAIERAGHGGGDFFVIKEFFDCIREDRRPEMDEYFATTCASVAILSHRSMLEKGVPYDIPDFHNEEERKKYENDELRPFADEGGEGTIPCCSVPDFRPNDEQYAKYLDLVK